MNDRTFRRIALKRDARTGRETLRWGFAGLLGAVLAGVVLLSGCAADPLSPAAPGATLQAADRTVGGTVGGKKAVEEEETKTWTGSTTPVKIDPEGTGPGGKKIHGEPMEKTVELDGDAGSTVTEGALTLVFPPGAFEGTETLTIIQPDDTEALWHFNLSETSTFEKSVTCRVEYKTGGGFHTMLWWDPEAGAWVDVGGFDDPAAGVFKINLNHFSTYALVEEHLPVFQGTGGWD